MTNVQAAAPTTFHVKRHSPSLWRVTLDNPPINLLNPAMITELHSLLDDIERDKHVAVVVIDSADPEFWMAHQDAPAVSAAAFEEFPAEPTKFHHWAKLLIRLNKSPAVTIAALRGRARGAGAEFALACDIRFASRERAVLGQFEVKFGVCPGGGCTARLPRLVGRGRAFEILLGGEDFDGELAERYGYVNRAVPDAEFVEFVDRFAERVSRHDLKTLAHIKRFVNTATQPPDEVLLTDTFACYEADSRPEIVAGVVRAIDEGFLQRSDLELNIAEWAARPENVPPNLPSR